MKRFILFALLVGLPGILQAQIPASVTTQGNITAAGSCSTASSTGAIVLAMSPNSSSIVVLVNGSFTGTLQFTASPDGNTFTNATLATTSTTSTGAWQLSIAGMNYFCVNASSLSGGSAQIVLQSSIGSGATAGGAVSSVTQGTIPWIVAGAGTAGSSGTAVLTVQGIASGTKVPVSIFDSNGATISAVTDPCDGAAKTAVPFSVSSATTTQLVAASASNKVYVCHIDIVVASANNIALVEDGDASCASPTAGMAGGTTAATGWNLTGNGISVGNGVGSVFQTAAVNRYVCIITSGTAQTSGNIMYVLAP